MNSLKKIFRYELRLPILIILPLLISMYCCSAQQIIPLEDFLNYRDNEIEVPDGTYFKDVNGLLNKFVGTWKGSLNNKNYEFRVEKHYREAEVTHLKYDKLRIRYKIFSGSGVLIEDTTNLPEDSIYILMGLYISKLGGYVLFYQGKETLCGQKGNVFISVYGSNNEKMQLYLYPDNEFIDSDTCPNREAAQILPTDPIELLKQ